MSEQAPPVTVPPAAAPAKPEPKQKLYKWIGAAAGVVIALGGIAKLATTYAMLPSCDSSRALNNIRTQFKDKDLADPALTDAKAVGENTSSQKNCEANYEIPQEKGILDYRIVWEGWGAKVLVTRVR
jgi:hypothetical protein